MQHRSHLAPKERLARSRLAQLLHEKPLLIGSLVSMPRRCGKPGCKCTKGDLHPGTYLALRVGATRKMVHIPQSLEAEVTQSVAAYQEAWHLMEQVSQSCFERLLKEKEQLRDKRS